MFAVRHEATKRKARCYLMDPDGPKGRSSKGGRQGMSVQPRGQDTKLAPDLAVSVSDILNALPFYVMLVDDTHHIVEANRAVQEQLGLDPGAVVGKYCPKAIHGLDEPWDACPLEQSVVDGHAVEREALDEQSGRWIRSCIYPIECAAPDGKRIYFHTVTDTTEAKEAEHELKASREQLRELSRYLESIREDERSKMAREIHDELGQALTVLKIDLSSLAKSLPQGEGALLRKTESMNGLVDEAIQTVKRISTELRPGALDDLGLADALEWLTGEFDKRTGIRARFSARPEEIVVDRERSTDLYRICQEALTNVMRHAEATRVVVKISRTGRSLKLRIDDNGRGIEEAQILNPRAFGLIGMRERARSWGGDVKIQRAGGRGTTVLVTIPLAAKEGTRR
jgi:PAS domain S-box-containing protein